MLFPDDDNPNEMDRNIWFQQDGAIPHFSLEFPIKIPFVTKVGKHLVNYIRVYFLPVLRTALTLPDNAPGPCMRSSTPSQRGRAG
ncbi:hypothetical protein NQ318_016568 [Aromia moschata]|uniref:Uncharacterized protein n=1 Tax=Aromia moschata TaxID=1265417 RepID=A0AAV8YZA7_9CUCU|nr:hypothetical protein NQ318_016568 [Aromia moschata]